MSKESNGNEGNSKSEDRSERPPSSESEPPIWPWVLPLAAYMLLLTFFPSGKSSSYASAPTRDGFRAVAWARQDEAPRPVGSEADKNTKPGMSTKDDASGARSSQTDPRASKGYALATLVRFLVVAAVLAFCFPHYLRQFPLRIGYWWLPVGVVGVVLWIALCHLNLEAKLLVLLGFREDALGSREAFNPFDSFQTAFMLYAFLTLRFGILSVLVPLAEEIFLRGFLVRYIHRPDWWRANFGKLKWAALGVAPVYGVLTHPSEALAAMAWFSLVT